MMSSFRFSPFVASLSLILPTLLIIGIFWLGNPCAEESIAAENENVKLPAVPASHQVYRTALRTTRILNYRHQKIDPCLRDLSQSLGVAIELHKSVRDSIQPERTIDIHTKTEVSHQTAIHLVMQQFGVYEYGIVFNKNKLTIVRGENYEGSSLRTYSLQGRSDFSIAERQRWIESTVAEVCPDTWSVKNETWIQPGESIFEIDVYQYQNVHNVIAKRRAQFYELISVDEDVQRLGFLGFGVPKSDDKEFDKKAAVLRLRKKFAFESIADRLKYESDDKQEDAPKLSPAAQKRIQVANENFDNAKKSRYAFDSLRSRSLQMLHEQEVDAFINRPGAGLSRMPTPGPSYLQERRPKDLPLASNEMIRTSDDVPVSLPATKVAARSRQVSLPSLEALMEFHQSGASAFLSPRSFGYIKNRDQVAGFQSHGFSFAPQLNSHVAHLAYRKPNEVWAIHRLELVSLLKHEKPAVYVSRNLPRMDKLKSVPTRALSRFEQSGLKRLYEGEDVITNTGLNRIEMIGSLRATKQCQQCHEVKSGALLGAFSYELLRDPQLDPKKHGSKPAF